MLDTGVSGMTPSALGDWMDSIHQEWRHKHKSKKEGLHSGVFYPMLLGGHHEGVSKKLGPGS